MQKRGDFTSNWLFYFVAVVVLVLMFYFGMTSLSDIKETSCAAETTLLVQRLQADAEEISYEQGSVVEKEYSVSCGADRVYFVDQAIDVLSPQQMLIIEPFPIISEEIISQTGKNVFFYSGSKVVERVEVTNLQLGFPYYRCLKVRSGKIKVRFTGNGAAVNVSPSGPQFDCNPLIKVIEPGIDESILAEAMGEGNSFELENGNTVVGSGDTPPADDTVSDLFNPQLGVFVTETNDLTITRVIEEVPGETKTVVNLLLERKDDSKNNFIYIERIPKRCVPDLEDGMLLDVKAGSTGKFRIRSDPLIVWIFPAGADPTMGYTLNTLLDEGCKKDIGGVPIRFKNHPPE